MIIFDPASKANAPSGDYHKRRVAGDLDGFGSEVGAAERDERECFLRLRGRGRARVGVEMKMRAWMRMGGEVMHGVALVGVE